MRPLTDAEIRDSLVNAVDDEVEQLTLPLDYPLTEWSAIEFLGWRDPSARQRAYLVTLRDDRPVGIVLRAATTTMSRRHSAICNLCHTMQPADQISLFSARRAGDAGRQGNSIGTYICADLSCSGNVRLGAPLAPHEVRAPGQMERRIADTLRRAESFVDEVLGAAAADR
ncbi:hypothetical protein ARHIZOSPH14_10450 [Agromyces rhizosphaerae]|uniref:Elongation factor G-binding protein C-terminal treble-clef zinc-finger domain-containing protein n=1 Tax=Agromyces rhizosphaerae TaxID=88374 RepID=A0A9W6CQR9_9MICO|nr:FBP domain-containing protein [Agromyces rhizosphaerae]GLI26803.1 hypothetical protein ARHIZOSPH14_10450 [Agromyces rhizosphaerae]